MFDEAALKSLTGFTLYPVIGGWQASSRWEGSTGWRVCVEKSIELAIKAALGVDGADDLC